MAPELEKNARKVGRAAELIDLWRGARKSSTYPISGITRIALGKFAINVAQRYNAERRILSGNLFPG